MGGTRGASETGVRAGRRGTRGARHAGLGRLGLQVNAQTLATSLAFVSRLDGALVIGRRSSSSLTRRASMNGCRRSRLGFVHKFSSSTRAIESTRRSREFVRGRKNRIGGIPLEGCATERGQRSRGKPGPEIARRVQNTRRECRARATCAQAPPYDRRRANCRHRASGARGLMECGGVARRAALARALEQDEGADSARGDAPRARFERPVCRGRRPRSQAPLGLS
jgi:hypothetical protein